MDVFKTLKPNQPGTKTLKRKYGEQLVAVRYRKGVNPNRIYTTVELIIDSKPYHPGLTHAPAKAAEDEKVALRIPYQESAIREQVKKAGARWDSKNKVWLLSYRKIRELGLKKWILKL